MLEEKGNQPNTPCCWPLFCLQTSTKTNEENPVWNEEFDLVVDEPVRAALSITEALRTKAGVEQHGGRHMQVGAAHAHHVRFPAAAHQRRS